MLLQSLTRQLILAHQVLRFTNIAKESADLVVGDIGCGYCELFTLLSRARKAKGSTLKYIGVDIDKDKKIIAQQLRPNVDYRIDNILNLSVIEPESLNIVVSGDVIEHFEYDEGLIHLKKMNEKLISGGLLIISYATPMSTLYRKNPFHLCEWTVKVMDTVLTKMNFEILDSFYLGLPKKNIKFNDSRIERVPFELARNVLSVVSNPNEGNEGITVARKL